MRERVRVVALGAGAALAVAFPASLAAQMVDAFADGDDLPAGAYALVPVIFGAMALGGWVVGRRRGRIDVESTPTPGRPHPVLEGALAGLVAIAVVLGLGIARQTVAEEDVAWATVPASAVAATALGALGSTLAGRSTARTRP